MSAASKDGVPPFSVVLALGNSQIHVGSTDCSNIATNVEAPVYQSFFAMLCVSQMSTQMTTMSDLGEALMTQGLEVRHMSLKI